MMRNLSNRLYQVSSGRLAVIMVLVFVLFMIFVLPDQAAKADVYAQGADSPDTSLFYSPQELYDMAEAYGEAGRAAYVRARFTFDLIFPAVYGVFLLVLVSFVWGKVLSEDSRWRAINLVPLLGVAFDLLENSAASLVMASYPQQRDLAATLAPVFTLVKWIFVYGSFGLLVLGLLFMGGLWLRKQFKK